MNIRTIFFGAVSFLLGVTSVTAATTSPGTKANTSSEASLAAAEQNWIRTLYAEDFTRSVTETFPHAVILGPLPSKTPTAENNLRPAALAFSMDTKLASISIEPGTRRVRVLGERFALISDTFLAQGKAGAGPAYSGRYQQTEAWAFENNKWDLLQVHITPVLSYRGFECTQ